MVSAQYVWFNGEFVPFAEASVPVMTHALHYGTGVFEGVRAYETERGPAVFRHGDHIDRLFDSARMYYMDIPYTKEQVRQATDELIRRNGFGSCYIRPLVFRGAGAMGLYPGNNPVEVLIAAWEWGSYLGDEGKRNGVRGQVSSWRRMSSDSFIPAAKASGQYLNSILAKMAAQRAGYEEAILLDDAGHVCEGSGENLFFVKHGKIATPGISSDILGGISRASVIQLARDLGYTLEERDVTRGEMYLAEEIFMTGTAAELTPLREVDDYQIGTGKPGPVTRALQDAFEDVLWGRNPDYAHWNDLVQAPVGGQALSP